MRYLVFMHILGVALAVGAGATHMQLMRDASKGGDDARIFLVAARSIRVKTELPAYVLIVLTGLTLVSLDPAYFRSGGWLHAKLTLVALLFGLLYLEGRKSRAILRTYTEGNLPVGMKQARRYSYRFAPVPLLLLVAILYLAVLRPF